MIFVSPLVTLLKETDFLRFFGRPFHEQSMTVSKLLLRVFLMENKASKDSEILKNVQESVAASERKRRELRFAYALNDFTQGKMQVLKNKEFFEELHVFLLADPADSQQLISLFRCLGDGALAEDLSVRERALALLSSTVKFHLDSNDKRSNKAFLIVLAQSLANWLEFETELLPGFSVLNKRLEDIVLWLLDNSCWPEADAVVALLHRIHSGSLEKNRAMQSLTNRTLHNLAPKNIVEKLINEYLLENEYRQVTRNILLSLGDKAIISLLNRVIHSNNKTERLTLLDLIPEFGEDAVPVLRECLKQNPPWAVVRNVIYLFSEIGIDTHYGLVERYLGHFDERVQHEMISCILKFRGKMMQSRLIDGLGLVSDRLKIYIIRLLLKEGDEDGKILAALLELAGDRANFSGQFGLHLFRALIEALKKFPCEESVEQLKIIKTAYSRQQGAEQYLLHIDQALKTIVPKLRHTQRKIDNSVDVVSFDSDPVLRQQAFKKMRKAEEEIQALVNAGKTQQAGLLLYNQAMAAAKIKDFSLAEALQERLLEIDSMAFSQVIKLSELIAEQKSSSISSHHLAVWKDLYEEMTTEDFNRLYYSLHEEYYHKGDIIVQAGETDNNLYFLNSGYVSLSCVVCGSDVFLKRMQPGDILGGEQFFSHSVWTITLGALSDIQVQVLEKEMFKKIVEESPLIENTLRKYCEKYVHVAELIKISGDDRREFPRYSVHLHTRNVLLDPFGSNKKRTFSGELFDISRQGLAFTIRLSKSDNARLLLGRHIMTSIQLQDQGLPELNGVIVGVRLHEPIMQDYSVHVKLAKKIDGVVFKRIISSERRHI
jgi:hypothetical protein